MAAVKKANKRKTRKKNKITVVSGIAHIHSTFNNTIVTITDKEGKTAPAKPPPKPPIISPVSP